MTTESHRTRMLLLVSMLHAFTHVYQVALLPLYLPLQRSFQLESVGSATFLVTLMMLAYFLPSYPMGVLADRISRRHLLGWGLAINGLGFLLLAFAPNYPVALLAMVISGIGGSCFHPAATALIARLFPLNTGRALGLIGVGASVGFFLGPIYSGWRAAQSGDWRAPILELGFAGLVAAALFLWLAEDTPIPPAASDPAKAGSSSVASTSLKARGLFGSTEAGVAFVAAATAFSLRDFAGSSMGSLGSLFLQNAHGFTVQQTGIALSGIFLAAVVSNPLFGHLSDRGRKRWTAFVQIMAAGLIALFPHLPGHGVNLYFLVFMAYGFFFMASYPMVEAAVMLAVHDRVRGRAFGLWITIGGLIGNLSHWLVGHWVEGFGARATSVSAYYVLYAGLAVSLIVSLVGLPFLDKVRRCEHPTSGPGDQGEPGSTPGALK